MALFGSRKKKAAAKAAPSPEEQAKTPKSHSRSNTISRSVSTPISRRNSTRSSSMMANQIAQESAFDPAFNRNIDSAYPPIMPVPSPPSSESKGVLMKNNTKAAKVLGLQSAPSSRPSSSHHRQQPLPSNHGSSSSDTSEDQKTASRHDSFNSAGETPKIGMLSSERPAMTFAEEMALEPNFSETSSQIGSRSRPPSEFGHSRQVSHDSFRPGPPRRHSSQHLTSRMPTGRPDFHPAEQMQRARSQHQVPTYGTSLPNKRMSMYADMERMDLRHGDVPIVPPFPGAHQPRMSFISMDQAPVIPSPVIRPVFPSEAVSTPNFRAARPAEPVTNSIVLPPLAVLDGLKVNKRGKLLDEEGDVIGELCEGELIDCVRQKANACGEVLDEYGRVVGRVRTLLGGIGISTPALNASSPAIMNGTADYFNSQPILHPRSPAMTPAMDPHMMQQRMQEDMMQKYRMIVDVPPVPVMPAAYQSEYHSPMLSAQHKYAVAPLGQSADARPAELAGDFGEIESLDSIPAFDLSEPFMPALRASPVSEPPVQQTRVSAVQTVSTDIEVEEADHIESNAASFEMESVTSVADDEEFVQACEELPPPIFNESRNTSFASIENVYRPQFIDLADLSQADDDMPTPREDAYSRIGDAIPQPEPTPVQRPTPTSPTATRFFHRPTPNRDLFTQPAKPTNSPTEREFAPADKAPKAIVPEPTALPPMPVPAKDVPEVKPQTSVTPAAQKVSRPAPPTATATAPADIPPLKSSMAPRRETRRNNTAPAAPVSEPHSTDDSMSEGEGVEMSNSHRKEVRISKLPPTTIPARSSLSRTLSDGATLGSKFSAMPSVPEAEPLPVSPFKKATLSPDSAAARPPPARAFSARAAPPLPAFPRQGFANSLPQSPFARANAMNNSGAGLQKRNSMPSRPGIPPAGVRLAMNKNRFTLNAPLVSSPLSDHRKTLSTITASSVSSLSDSPSGSETPGDRKYDSISLYSTPARSRTIFTHGGRVTIEEGDPTPAEQAKDAVQVTERPVTSDGLKTELKPKKKGRFSMHFGKKTTPFVAAH